MFSPIRILAWMAPDFSSGMTDPQMSLQVKHDSVYMQVFLWRALAPQITDSHLTWIELPYFKWAPSLSGPEQWRFKTHVYLPLWILLLYQKTLFYSMVIFYYENVKCTPDYYDILTPGSQLQSHFKVSLNLI